jgi:hypothetical protein
VAFAFASSFSVYLIPLFGPHAVWLLGETLFQGEARKSPQWMTANCAVALLLQLLAAGFFYWFFQKPAWRRGIPLLFAFPFVFLTLEWVYLVAIPTRFLEEPDTAPETASWPLICTAPGVNQINLRTASELWVRFNAAPNTYAVLTMPGCRLATVNLPQPAFTRGKGVDFSIDLTSVAPGGRAIAQKYQNQKYQNNEARQSWWLTPGTPPPNDAALLPLEPPAGHAANSGAPILSTDGQWVAWLEAIPNTGPPVLNRVFLRPRDAGEHEKIVDLSALGPASYSLQKLDMESRELMLWKTDRLVSIGFDGTLKKEFSRPAAARPQQSTYLEMGEYWLAWDAYRENGPYLVEWSLPSGSGTHRVPLGRTIHSAAADAAGKRIAVSVGTSLSIGDARDAVYVLSATDGREIFRKYLPRYSRSPVAFLDHDFLAYSDPSGVRVLRVPD